MQFYSLNRARYPESILNHSISIVPGGLLVTSVLSYMQIKLQWKGLLTVVNHPAHSFDFIDYP